MKSSAREVIESIVDIVENRMGDYLKGGAEYISKVEFTGNEFPKLFLFQNGPSTLGQRANTVSLNMRFLDVAEGVNDKQERNYSIQSDMEQAASILMDYLKADDILLSNIEVNANPIYISGGDGLSGVEVNVTFPLMRPCVVTFDGGDGNQDLSLKALAKQYTLSPLQTIQVSINDLAESNGPTPPTFQSVQENENFTFTISEDKKTLTIEALVTDLSLTGVQFTVTNGRVKAVGLLALQVDSVAEGIQYVPYEELWSGYETSFVTGDEGFKYQQGDFESHIVSNPDEYAQLDPSDQSGLTLLNNNIFGNKNRYTAPDGSQNFNSFKISVDNYPQPMGMIIDHLYGMVTVSYINATLGGQFGYSANMEESRLAGLAIAEYGYSRFTVMSIGEMETMFDRSIEAAYKVNPFNWSVGTGLVATSTPYASLPNRGLVVLRSGIVSQFNNSQWGDTRMYFFAKNAQEALAKLQFTTKNISLDILGQNTSTVNIDDILLNSTGENATIASVTPSANLSAVISGDGLSVSITPDVNSNFSGTVEFTVESASNTESGTINVEVTEAQLFLDKFSGSISSVGFRKLRSAYAGDCVQIIETGGNTLAEIGFSGDYVDEAAIAAHCGVNEGYITIGYNQSAASGGNWTDQGDPARRPRIWDGSQIDKDGLFAFFNSINGGAKMDIDIPASGSYSIISAVKVITPFSNALLGGNSASNLAFAAQDGSTSSSELNATKSNVYVDGTLQTPSTRDDVFNLFAEDTMTTLYLDLDISFETPVTLGYNFGSTLGMYDCFEIHIYDNPQLTNRAAMETDIKDYYGL